MQDYERCLGTTGGSLEPQVWVVCMEWPALSSEVVRQTVVMQPVLQREAQTQEKTGPSGLVSPESNMAVTLSSLVR